MEGLGKVDYKRHDFDGFGDDGLRILCILGTLLVYSYLSKDESCDSPYRYLELCELTRAFHVAGGFRAFHAFHLTPVLI